MPRKPNLAAQRDALILEIAAQLAAASAALSAIRLI